MPFLYGNHVVKAHLGRITEDTPEHQGVVVFSMSDVPLVRTTFPPSRLPPSSFLPSYSIIRLYIRILISVDPVILRW